MRGSARERSRLESLGQGENVPMLGKSKPIWGVGTNKAWVEDEVGRAHTLGCQTMADDSFGMVSVLHSSHLS